MKRRKENEMDEDKEREEEEERECVSCFPNISFSFSSPPRTEALFTGSAAAEALGKLYFSYFIVSFFLCLRQCGACNSRLL